MRVLFDQGTPAPNETLTVKIRYKEPAGSDSKLLVFPLVDRELAFNRASTDFRFAAAVASFGMLLRDSPYKGTATFDSTLAIAQDSTGSDRNGYRHEFMQLVQRARQIRGR